MFEADDQLEQEADQKTETDQDSLPDLSEAIHRPQDNAAEDTDNTSENESVYPV